MMEKMDVMLEALTQYYEAAGYIDIYEKKLKMLSEKEITELYSSMNDMSNQKLF